MLPYTWAELGPPSASWGIAPGVRRRSARGLNKNEKIFGLALDTGGTTTLGLHSPTPSITGSTLGVVGKLRRAYTRILLVVLKVHSEASILYNNRTRCRFR